MRYNLDSLTKATFRQRPEDAGQLEKLLNRARTFNNGVNVKTGEVAAGGSRHKTYRVVNLEAQGRLLKVKQGRFLSASKNLGSGRRGVITQFSAESRKRLLDHFARLDRSVARRGKHPLFVTLTYQNNMTDNTRAQRDLKTWWERVVERHTTAWCVWKKEYQERGAIHFHLIIGNVGYLGVNIKPGKSGWDAQAAWNEVSEQTANNSLDVERIKSFGGVMAYAAKYLGKEQEVSEAPDHQQEEYPIAGITRQEQLRTIAKHGVDPCIEPIKRRAKIRASMGLSISHKCAVSKNGSVGRFWGILGRKHIPYATRRTRTIIVKDRLYKWWLSVVDNEYCALNRGWTVYTEEAGSHYMRAVTAYNRYPDKAWLDAYHADICEFQRVNLGNWWHLPSHKQRKWILRLAMTRRYGIEYDAPP